MADEEGEVPEPVKPKKCLIVLTSVTEYPDGSPTGFYLSEAVHPYLEFLNHGWEVGFCSPAGTAIPDPSSVEAADAACLAFWEDPEKKALTETQTKVADVPLDTVTAEYEALLLSGGFGTMWDFPECAELQALIKAFYAAEGHIVAGVCHGPIGFLNVVLDDETKLLAEKQVTAFTNAEEGKMGKYEVVSKPSGPGSCQDAMTEAGAKFMVGLPFECQVVKSGTLFTAQNPQSATALATAIVYAFDTIKADFEPERLELLKKREACVKDIEAAEKAFVAGLSALKKQETAGGAVADKLEELQSKAKVSKAFHGSKLTDLDRMLARNASLRQVAIDDAAAKAAAVEE